MDVPLKCTIGASGDFTDGESPDVADREQFNPKFGVTWNPHPNTTLRGAVFKYFKRTLITDQTIEPTQVAGFNQFFDDFNGTEAWRYGGAIDQKFTETIYGGGEFSYRDLSTQVVTGPDTSDSNSWDEYLGSVYLFLAPHDWLSLKAECQYEYIKRDRDFTDGVKHMDTYSVPLGVNFFHPSGLSASAQATYYYQDGKFQRFDGTFEKDDDNFVLVNAVISYRFPKRYGFLTIGVTNLFDEDFNYFDIDSKNPQIQPDRVFFSKVTLALP